ncbi:hypothetical protein A7K93_04095 [Candidatus Methylacidiphilum fumarolicum]|nr:hypothetical protein A7K73_02360 [Candidatus Methylacidiphilum fumarolicum]TFE74206.1 hypothetical protein A7K93_04095 [Candidatus Methylacidiphilum fumarolicum]TFE75705.1 hypothetical protein A7K72_00775 [Candidatus Methylacidiphilum fumarolicum]TFE75865.1 hypothetical protein A7D33_00990 [Candidatus Methylacidiphilum fumarolicum]
MPRLEACKKSRRSSYFPRSRFSPRGILGQRQTTGSSLTERKAQSDRLEASLYLGNVFENVRACSIWWLRESSFHRSGSRSEEKAGERVRQKSRGEAREVERVVRSIWGNGRRQSGRGLYRIAGRAGKDVDTKSERPLVRRYCEKDPG